MRKSGKKDFVSKMLDCVFGSVHHTSQLEREVHVTMMNQTEYYISQLTSMVCAGAFYNCQSDKFFIITDEFAKTEKNN